MNAIFLVIPSENEVKSWILMNRMCMITRLILFAVVVMPASELPTKTRIHSVDVVYKDLLFFVRTHQESPVKSFSRPNGIPYYLFIQTLLCFQLREEIVSFVRFEAIQAREKSIPISVKIATAEPDSRAKLSLYLPGRIMQICFAEKEHNRSEWAWQFSVLCQHSL